MNTYLRLRYSNIYMEEYSYSSLLRKFIIIIVISIAIYSILVYMSNISLEILSYLLYIIIISSIPALLTFLLKGFRFYLIIKRLLPDLNMSLMRSIIVRVASELFSFLGMSYIGDEAFRIYYLNRAGVDMWKSIWTSYLEVFEEVLVASSVVIIGSLVYFLRGIRPFSIILGTIISLIIVMLNIIFLLGGKRIIFHVDRMLESIIGRISRSFYSKIRDRLFSNIEEGEIIKNMIVKDKVLLGLTILLSYLIALSSGLTLYIVLTYFRIEEDFFFSVYLVYITLAISSLPITIGGLGLSEAYILYVGSDFTSHIPWLLPVAYRISSYFIPLILCLILFVWAARSEKLL